MDKELYEQLESGQKTIETIVEDLQELRRTFPIGDIDDVHMAIKTGSEFITSIEVLKADLILHREEEN